MANFFFNSLVAAANVTQEVPIDGQTGVWLKSGTTVISSAMKMTGAVVSSGYTQNVYNRGKVISGTVELGAGFGVHSGGIVSSTTVNRAPANLTASAGTVWDNVYFLGRGNTAGDLTSMTILPGATVTNLSAGRATRIYVGSGASLTSPSLLRTESPYGFATLFLSAGGVANNVNCEGVIYVYGSASAVSLSVMPSFQSVVYGGGVLVDATIDAPAKLEMRSLGLASGLTVLSGGTLTVSSGASALAVTSNAGAVVTVAAGGYIEYVTP